MKRGIHRSILALLAVAAVTGCDSSRREADALQKEISAYAEAPAPAAAEKIEQGFQLLDAEIENLRRHGKTAQSDELSRLRDSLRAQYLSARMSEGLQKMKQAAQGLGEKIRQAGEALGDGVTPSPAPEN